MRKTMGQGTGLLVMVLALVSTGGQAFAAEKLTKVAEGVYSYADVKNGGKSNSFGANAGIIVGKDGIVVVDTLVSAKEAKRFLRDIRAVSKKPIKYVINTHYHLDHVFGNCEFAKLGAVIIAQENDAKAMAKSAAETLKNSSQFGLSPEDMKGTTPAYPVLTYGDRMRLDAGGVTIELIHARHAHTDGDTLVYLPERKVLFAGDILFTEYHPFLAEGDIAQWATALDEIKAMDVEKVIPGHGPLSGKKELEDMQEYIRLFDQKASALATQSHDATEIATALQGALPQRREGAWLIGANVQMKYLPKQ